MKKNILPIATFVAGIILALVYVHLFGLPFAREAKQTEAASCPWGYTNLGSLTNIHTGERSTVCENYFTGSIVLVKEATAKASVEGGLELTQ